MSERLKGKVAIVTGSTQGIGLAIARRFAAEGAMVTLNSHREDDAARAITAELGPERSLFVHADVADRAAMEAWPPAPSNASAKSISSSTTPA
jgi:NAD(P)-dependent dehydrogenase (short-subunit alcohol dehydrogenase family)